MIELNQLRKMINEIDSELISIFKKRLKISKDIGNYKKENNLEIYDSNREQEIIEKFLSLAKKDEKIYIEQFLQTLMDISKEVQEEEWKKR